MGKKTRLRDKSYFSWTVISDYARRRWHPPKKKKKKKGEILSRSLVHFPEVDEY